MRTVCAVALSVLEAALQARPGGGCACLALASTAHVLLLADLRSLP
jgi:hypothetical protein